MKRRNIVYDPATKLTLDVSTPRFKKSKAVLVFAHGGNWETGSKRIYRYFGKGWGRKGVTTVVFNYRLYPDTTNAGMANDAANALAWTHQNISRYKGDPQKIFVAGHSAGAQLAALVAMDPSYLRGRAGKEPVRGIILIDPYGLDVFDEFNQGGSYKRDMYLSVFSSDPEQWKKASPYWHLDKQTPPVISFLGGDTYPGIIRGTKRFHDKLLTFQPSAKLIEVPGKKHAPMILMFLNPRNRAYKLIMDFMQNPQK
jgi:acetyl esterase/lipase